MTSVMTLNRPVVKRVAWSKLDFAILCFATVFAVCALIALSAGQGVLADTGVRTLTDMFQTKSFRGSAEALANADFIGVGLHYAISWFSFLGLCLTLYQKFITLLYLSSRNLFDTIYEIKVNKMKGGFLGYKNLMESLFVQGENGNQGGGVDVFITFFYSLLPNVKAYSDYCPDKLAANGLQETDKPSTYMLKTAIPTIMLVFFLTIGYSGTLARAYGVVVDGMASAADQLVSQDLEAWIKQQMGSLESYDFLFGNFGTEAGHYAEKVATALYRETLAECKVDDPTFKTRLGMVIQATVLGDTSDPEYIAPENAGAPAQAILAGGNDVAANVENLAKLVTATMPEAIAGDFTIKTDNDIKTLQSPKVTVITSPVSPGNIGIVWSIDKFIRAASGVTEDDTAINTPTVQKYLHVVVQANVDSKTRYLIKETAPTPGT